MLKFICSLIVGASLLVLVAAPVSIGTVKSAGDFRVDGSAIHGNGTVFDGNLIETAAVRTVVQLSGAEVTLLPDSRAKVYRDRIALEKGSTLLRGDANHAVEAVSLRIAPTSKDSVVQIELGAPGSVSVAARSGDASVRNSSGVLVASLRAGMALAFTPQSGAATQVKMSGVLESSNGKYFLTDAATKVKVELVGSPDLAKFVGKRVDVAGSSMPGVQAAAGASQVVTVVTITAASNNKKAAAAAGAAGAGAGAGAAAAGMAVGTTVAIVGGVAVAGTVIGLAASGTFSGSENASHN